MFAILQKCLHKFVYTCIQYKFFLHVNILSYIIICLLCYFKETVEYNLPPGVVESQCVNGEWEGGECQCSHGFTTVHEKQDHDFALQPVYCNDTLVIVLGAYAWSQEDILQLTLDAVSITHQLQPMSYFKFYLRNFTLTIYFITGLARYHKVVFHFCLNPCV